jgi:Flp pilus assembly protein TadD
LPASIKIVVAEVTSEDRAAASRHFAEGLEKYHAGQFEAAVASFAAGTSAAPSDAKYAYFHALALYSVGKKAEAEARLLIAIELEAAAPVANWGRAMERVQGEARIWVETARQQLRGA